MLLLGIRLVLNFLLIWPTLAQCNKEESASSKQKTAKSNLLDMEIFDSMNFLFANIDKFDSQISIETTTLTTEHPNKIHASTDHPSTAHAVKSTTQKPNDCGAKITALTNIVYNSPFASVQYWLLKPKVI
jgi:hypothetical protein